MPVIALALVIAAILGGGTAYAAKASLPGDLLWNFKTAVNENLQGALAQNDQTKANWDISIAVDRLKEAQLLATQDKLSATAQAEITANFNAHVRDLTGLVQKLQAEGKTTAAAELATRFQATVAKQATSLQTNATNADALLLSDLHDTLAGAASLSASAAAAL